MRNDFDRLCRLSLGVLRQRYVFYVFLLLGQMEGRRCLYGAGTFRRWQKRIFDRVRSERDAYNPLQNGRHIYGQGELAVSWVSVRQYFRLGAFDSFGAVIRKNFEIGDKK